MTCSQCQGEWCWLCSRGINNNVSWHYDPRNVMGCGGMQMQYEATSGCFPTTIRRCLHLINMLIGGSLVFVVGLTAFVMTLILNCICCPLAVSKVMRTDFEEANKYVAYFFFLLFGFGPALALLLFNLSLAIVLECALLPLLICFAVNECVQGRTGTGSHLKMLFLPLVLFKETAMMFFRNDH